MNTFLLWRGLVSEGVLKPSGLWPRFLIRVVLANLAMGALLWWIAGDTLVWAQMPFIERVLRGTGGIALGAGVYFAMLFITGMRYRDLRTVA